MLKIWTAGLSEVTRTPPASMVKTATAMAAPPGACRKNVTRSPMVVPVVAMSKGISQKLSAHEMTVALVFGVEKLKPVVLRPANPPSCASVPPKVAGEGTKVLKPVGSPPPDEALAEVTVKVSGVGSRNRSPFGKLPAVWKPWVTAGTVNVGQPTPPGNGVAVGVAVAATVGDGVGTAVGVGVGVAVACDTAVGKGVGVAIGVGVGVGVKLKTAVGPGVGVACTDSQGPQVSCG